MFERRHEKLAPFRIFAWRMLSSLGIGIGMIAVSLFIGIFGYHWIAGLNWLEALLEASMILGGMGPVNPLKSDGAKLFASVYALFSGLIFIGVMGVVLTPLAHRMMHKFHVDDESLAKASKGKPKATSKD